MKHTLRTVTALSLALVAGIFLLAPPAAQAQINYQGRLTDAVGAPLADGQYSIQFSLWTAATGGAAPVWGPYVLDGGVATGHGPLADLVGSRFNVIIGSQDTASRSLTTAMTASTSAYLEIKVGNNAPISPRQIILAAPRALLADVIPRVTPNATGVDILGNLGVSGSATVTGNAAVTGNVGIGTPTPSAKLDVNGSVVAGGPSTGSHFFISDNQIQQRTAAAPAAMHLNVSGGDVLVNNKRVAVGEENLRIVRGIVRGNTSLGLNKGAGYTVVNYVGGQQQPETTVTFTQAFTDLPAVALTMENASEAWHVSVISVTTTNFNVRMWRSDSVRHNTAFHFTAIGPR